MRAFRRVLVGCAVAAAVVGPAIGVDAKIVPVDVSCTNPGGHEAGGQQPSCKNNAHEQESENQNPAGHAPPGHNPEP